ncbi:MAG: asparagine synthase, glutamine-hydrolyzing [Bacteroidetes bacterium]|jgi:asparagine synthase (glutamine-hydrolysing)|nr:asparagine synthase, glutamine-hydrolyzing [Bacteroidota bacterium]
MCGINGIVSAGLPEQKGKELLLQMNACLSHRGPDADGTWNAANVFLGHRRLSIIDLSESSNQPMVSNDGRYVIIYNGELYNYKELKFELQRSMQGSMPYVFRTASDTEVVIAAYIRWGKECLEKFNGMFAFALYDTVEKELFIARDRLGIKPLYYTNENNHFVFSSEIRAILKTGLVEKRTDENALVQYVQYQTVHAPLTIVKDVYMLMPGHYCVYKNNSKEITCYWDLKKKAPETKDQTTYADVCKNVNDLLHKAVERRLVADVPFGAFLSGGIDSSAIVGIMSGTSSEKVNTFSVTFDEKDFSEEAYSDIVAKKFNTQHHNIRLQVSDFLNELPESLDAMDHPGGDGANSYVVSKATKKAGITMALSGLGGDELFCGYDVFNRALEIKKKQWLNLVPRMFRIAGAGIVDRKKTIASGKTAAFLSKPILNFDYFYPLSREVYNDTQVQMLTGRNTLPFNEVYKTVRLLPTDEKNHLLSKCSQAEISTYMQNVLLRDADQMSMAVALEVRVPFLDYTLVEYVLGLPDKHKIPVTPKKLLTDSLAGLLPTEIVDRKKMGFVFPWKHWLKNELKTFCEEQLHELQKRSDLNEKYVDALWSRFLNDDPQITWSRIWHLVVLGHWLKKLDFVKS